MSETLPTPIPLVDQDNPATWHPPTPHGLETYNPVPGVDLSHKPKVLLVGGAGAVQKTLEGTVDAFEDKGLETYSFDPVSKPATKRNKRGQKRYQDAKVDQVVGLIDEIADEDEKITLFGHSLGGPVALRAAQQRSDKVERVVLSNSEGFDEGKLPFTRLVGRFCLELIGRKNQTWTSQGRRQTWTGLKDMVRHPVAFVGSAKDGARTYAMPVVEELEADGVKVDVITSNFDQVYRPKKVLAAAKQHARGGQLPDVPDELPFSSISSYFAAKPRLTSRRIPEVLKARVARPDEINDFRLAMRGVKSRKHRLAGKYAGHDQPIIYPRYAAEVVSQLVNPSAAQGDKAAESLEIRNKPDSKATLAQRTAVAAQAWWLNSELRERLQNSKMRERFVSGEHAKRNRVIVAGVGVVAAAGALYLSKRGFDLPFEFGSGGTEGADTAVPGHSESGATAPVAPGPEAVPAPRGDVSGSLNLPAGYISEVADGYEVTAMPSANTDSVWRAAEHSLSDRLGRQPDVVQIDALKDILGERLLDVGDKVSISNEQIERALEIARRQSG